MNQVSKILIIGKDSFIGRNFIRYSNNKSVDEVSLLDKSPDEIDFKKYDTAIHLAAIVHQSSKIPESTYFEINRDLCLKVAIAAKSNGIQQFVFLSTVKVYGDQNDFPDIIDEDTPCSPNDPYGKSKLAAEKALLELNDNDFTVSIIRTPLVYGRGVKANMFNIIRLVDICPILPFNGINNRRSFDYVENLIGFIDRVIELRSSGIFLAMDENSLSTSEIVKMISVGLNKKRIIIGIPVFMQKAIRTIFPKIFMRQFGSYEFKNNKTLRILDYKPKFTTDYGIKQTVYWYLSIKGRN
jgi:UDP-glucose 4-epimerase